MPADAAGLRQLLSGLRATRSYLPDPVSDDLLTRWLEAARWCGSSRNSQPWRFVVVRDRDVLAALSHLGEDAEHVRGAAVAIALAAVEGPFPFSTIFDLGRVAQSLMLAAAADGVGSCIAVLEPASNIEEARQLLGVPPELRLDLVIAFGYPDGTPSAPRADRPSRGRLPLAQLVGYERGLPSWSRPDRS